MDGYVGHGLSVCEIAFRHIFLEGFKSMVIKGIDGVPQTHHLIKIRTLLELGTL